MSRAALAVGLKFKCIAEPMSPDELDKLAHRLAESKSRSQSARIRETITTGFYAGS